MRRFAPFLAAFLLVLLASPPANAWSKLGHRLVGALAQRHLDPAVQAEVARLLAGEPRPDLAGVSTWADTLRDEDPPRFKATSPWHYVKTQPGSCSIDVEQDCRDGKCVTAAIEAQRRILADRSQPLEARRDALKFLVHFVGDVHQPFHANSRTDKGGNDYQISLRTDIEPEAYARNRYANGVMGTNLHSIWDYYILESRGLSLEAYTTKLDAQPWPPMHDAAGAALIPKAWAGESCRLVDARQLYPQSHVMDHDYLDQMRPLAEQRIRQAAYRLASLLNQTLAK